MQGHVIKARDGRELVSYLTLPARRGAAAARAVADGAERAWRPWGRDGYAYRRDDQWLANRDYAVLSGELPGLDGLRQRTSPMPVTASGPARCTTI